MFSVPKELTAEQRANLWRALVLEREQRQQEREHKPSQITIDLCAMVAHR